MWRFDDLSIVTEVIKQGSFIKASQKLGIPSSTISRRVNEFESAIGVRLIERNSRKLSLTEKGASLFQQCAPEMQKIKQSIEDISSNNNKAMGALKITAPITLGNELLNTWFCDFSKLYPEITLNIILSNQYEDILDDSFDIAIRVGPLKDSEFIGQYLFTTDLVLCASPEYLASSKLDLNLNLESIHDLARYDFLAYQDNKDILKVRKKSSHTLNHEVGSEEIEVTLSPRITSTSTAILRQAAVNGLGITCLPKVSIKAQLASGELVAIFKSYEALPKKEIYTVYPSNVHLPEKMRVFLDYIKQQADKE